MSTHAEPRRPVTVIEPHGHTGHTGTARRVVTLAWTLALTDWKLRFYGSVLGAVWSVARPFAYFAVVYIVFTDIVGLDKSVDNYGVYILFGLVIFTFFSEVTASSVQALTLRENLLRKMYFPPIVVPLTVVLTALLNLAMTLVAVFIFVLANGIYPTWSWLELPVALGLVAVFATGLGMLLSALYVRYRDVQPIWEVVTQMLFYATPVIYVATIVPESYRAPYLCNPLAAVLTQLRHAIVDPDAPTLSALIGSDARILVPLGVVAVTFALGFWVFQRASPRFAENL
jgi:ABC-2 type transport system permease protein